MSMSAGEIRKLNSMCPSARSANLGDRLNALNQYGVPFRKKVTLTSAAAGTAVPILTEYEVAGGTVYVEGAIFNVGGATAWTDATATIVKVQDTAGSPAAVITVAKAGLTGNAIVHLQAASNVTLAASVAAGSGVAATRGISVKADANFGAGSDLYVTVWGVISGANV